MKTKREKGLELEKYVAEKLREVTKDNTIRITKASSGGTRNTEIADILSKDYFIECKNNEKATISLKVWDKLINSIPMNNLKTPLYIIQRPTKEKLITLRFEDFLRLLLKING